MFERFTEKAIKVIMLAQEESRRLGHSYVGSEQLLLGLICEGSSDAAKALKQAGVTRSTAREAVEKIIGRSKAFVPVEIPFTPRAKRILEASWNFARGISCDYIGPEHLLAGLLTEKEGVAIRALSVMDVSAERVQSELEKIMNLSPGAVSQLQPTPPAEPESADCNLCGEKIKPRAVMCRHCQRPQGEQAKRCPICSEVIWKDAINCRFCKSILAHS